MHLVLLKRARASPLNGPNEAVVLLETVVTVKQSHLLTCSDSDVDTTTLLAAAPRPGRGDYPPYIHFTLQKTNRDTQDALGHLSRNLHVNIKDLSVAGTKDKRGVTVQRVSLNRHNKTVEEVWKLANSIGPRRTLQDAMTQRGERGIRISDLNYRKSGLELGMLKGNAFIITLR